MVVWFCFVFLPDILFTLNCTNIVVLRAKRGTFPPRNRKWLLALGYLLQLLVVWWLWFIQPVYIRIGEGALDLGGLPLLSVPPWLLKNLLIEGLGTRYALSGMLLPQRNGMESSGMTNVWLKQYQSAFFNVYVPVPGKAQVENAVKQTHESKWTLCNQSGELRLSVT